MHHQDKQQTSTRMLQYTDSADVLKYLTPTAQKVRLPLQLAISPLGCAPDTAQSGSISADGGAKLESENHYVTYDFNM